MILGLKNNNMTRNELDSLIGDNCEELKNRLHWIIGNHLDDIISSVSANRLEHDIKAEFRKFGINIDVNCEADNGIMYISSSPLIKDLLGL